MHLKRKHWSPRVIFFQVFVLLLQWMALSVFGYISSSMKLQSYLVTIPHVTLEQKSNLNFTCRNVFLHFAVAENWGRKEASLCSLRKWNAAEICKGKWNKQHKSVLLVRETGTTNTTEETQNLIWIPLGECRNWIKDRAPAYWKKKEKVRKRASLRLSLKLSKSKGASICR